MKKANEESKIKRKKKIAANRFSGQSTLANKNEGLANVKYSVVDKSPHTTLFKGLSKTVPKKRLGRKPLC